MASILSTYSRVEYEHLLKMVRDAQNGGWSVQSTGEKLACALVLNRADWLIEMDYTMAEAIDRVGLQWVAMLCQVEREIHDGAASPDTRTS